MKKFYKCNLPDLLLDEDFRRCVSEREAGNSTLWEELLALNPDEVPALNQGRVILLSLGPKVSSLTQQELTTGVAAILAHTTNQKSKFWYSHQFRWLSIAASVLLIIGVFVFKANRNKSAYSYEGIVATVAQPMLEEVNDTDSEKRITLPDGSSVVLLPSGKISFSNPFIQNNRREIYLSGDAFFEIRKDTLNPLYVYANGLLTRVVGTSFLIKTTENQVKVVVRTGRVAVTSMQPVERNTSAIKEVFVIPNQQALFSLKNQAISTSNVNFSDQIKNLKHDQVLSFENRSIAEVFETLQEVYGVPFVYNRTVMAKCKLHVAFTDESLFAKLDIITRTIGAHYSVTDGRIIIVGKGCN